VGIRAWRDRLGPETGLYNGTHGTNERHLYVTPSTRTVSRMSIHPCTLLAPGFWLLAPRTS
jgi:hypothetical protein